MGRVCLLNSTGTEVVQPASKTDIDTMSAKITACNTGAVVVSSSALPTGAATSAAQASLLAAVALESGGNLENLVTIANLINNNLLATNEPYSGVVSHALTLAAGATAEPLVKAYAAGTSYTTGQVCSSSGVVYVALQNGTGQTPASSPTYWRAVTPRAVLMSAPDTNAADITWGSASHQAQVLAAGGTAIKISIDTTGLLAIYAKGTISNVVNYVIFE